MKEKQNEPIVTGGDTYTAGAAIAAPFANMGRQHIIIAFASSDNFYNTLNKFQYTLKA